MLEVLTLFVFNIVIYSIPLLYATCGEIMVEKSGSLNLGVEGTMAIGPSRLSVSRYTSLLVMHLVQTGRIFVTVKAW